MAAPTRFTKLGTSGRTGTSTNTQDSYTQTFEFPITIAASAAAQDTGIQAPLNMQAMSAYLRIRTAEATGTTKTVSVGIVGASASFLSAQDVSAVGAVGTPVTAAVYNGSNVNFAYTLGSADFAELDATVVLTLKCSDI
jgi:hypothetical protein